MAGGNDSDCKIGGRGGGVDNHLKARRTRVLTLPYHLPLTARWTRKNDVLDNLYKPDVTLSRLGEGM